MNSLASSESFAIGFSAILLDAAFKSVLLLVLAAVAMRCMHRCSAAARHLTLCLVVGSLLVLPILSWALPRLDVLPPWLGAHTLSPKAADDPKILPSSRPTQVTSVAASGRTQDPQALQTVAAVSPFAESTSREFAHGRGRSEARRWTLLQWGPTVWAVGVFFAVAPAAAGLLSLWRLQRKSRVEEAGPLWESLQRLSSSVGLRHRIRLLTTASRQMPMTWGILQPKVLLPAESIEWPEERQRVVLLHELAHIQRCDFVTTLFIRFTCALYWFNPLVWLAARQLRLEQEQACDDTVLGAGARPAGYAEELLRIAGGRSVGSLEVLGALAMARPSSLEARLLAILDATRNRRSLTRLGIVMTVLLTTLAIVPMSMLRAGQNAGSQSPAGSAALPSTSGTAAAAGLNRGLVAWWRGDGDGKDSAGKHHGEFPFGMRYLPGVIGQAFDFRRSYAIEDLLRRVSIPDSPEFQLSEAMTLEARIHPIRFGGIVLIRGDDRPGFDTWQLDLITPGKISFNFDDAENKSAELLAPIQLKKWHHVVATFDRGTMKLYLNGVLVAESQTDLRPNPILDARHNPALGIGNTGGKYYSIPFDGLVDEVKIYNRALSEAEIAESLKS